MARLGLPRAFPLWALISIACGEGGGDATDGASSGGETGSGSSTGPDDTGTSDGADTGEPREPFRACDPADDQACADDEVCAGAGPTGLFCFPRCGELGSPCGEGDVCARGAGTDRLACIPVDACDPVTAEGCPDEHACVPWQLEPRYTGCVPEGPGGPAARCDPTAGNECAAGSTCLGSDPATGTPGYCIPWCAPGGTPPLLCGACIEIAADLGICAECSVIDDACPEGSQCQPTSELLAGICVEYGPGQHGDPCIPNVPGSSCAEGLVCAAFGGGAGQCIARCDPAMPMCPNADEHCTDVGLVEPRVARGLNLCLPTEVTYCDPTAPTGCATEEICFSFDASLGVCAAPCDPTAGAAGCTGNYACVPEQDGGPFPVPFVAGNGACGTTCATADDCGGETCVSVAGLAVTGVCAVAPPSCDATDPTSCGAVGTTCVARSDAAEGVCLPGCFVQDPGACEAVPAACQVRSDPAWHAGACVGQDTACDPVTRAGCPDGLSCNVLGGGPVGGVATLCSPPGPIGAGGSCAAEACALGLLCVDDVCSPTCDPEAPSCAAGTCVDVGVGAGFPPGTVGACL